MSQSKPTITDADVESARLMGFAQGLEAAARIPDERGKEWQRIRENGGSKNLGMSKGEVFTAETENELAAFKIRAIKPV